MSVNICPQDILIVHQPPVTLQLLFPVSTYESFAPFEARNVETHFQTNNPFLPPEDSWASINSVSTLYTSPTIFSKAIINQYESSAVPLEDSDSLSSIPPISDQTETLEDGFQSITTTSAIGMPAQEEVADFTHDETFRRVVSESVSILFEYAASISGLFIHRHVFDYLLERLLSSHIYSHIIHGDDRSSKHINGVITQFVNSHKLLIKELILVSLYFILPFHLYLLFFSFVHSSRKSINMNLVTHSHNLTRNSAPLITSLMCIQA